MQNNRTPRIILIGLSLLVAVAALAVIGTSYTYAALVGKSDFANAQYVITAFENGKPKTIKVTIAGVAYTFTDSNTSDSQINLKSGNAGFLCSQTTDPGTGITLEESPKPVPGGGSYYSGYIVLSYSGDTNKKCTEGDAQETLNYAAISAIYNVPGMDSGSAAGSPEGGTAGCQWKPDNRWNLSGKCEIAEPKCKPGYSPISLNCGQYNGTTKDNQAKCKAVSVACISGGSNQPGGSSQPGGSEQPGGSDQPSDFQIQNPLKGGTVPQVLDAVANFLFAIGLALVTVMVLWGGFQMLTSAGNPAQIDKGKQTLLWAIIGTVVLLVSFSITKLIQNILGGESGPSPTEIQAPSETNRGSLPSGESGQRGTKPPLLLE